MSSKHDELIKQVIHASSESSTAAVFFHTAMAEQAGLGATDEKALYVLRREGPLTPGEIALQTGLTSASVTSLIDRLEHKGFVRRVHDTQDRRRIIVEPDETRLAELDRLFSIWQESFMELLMAYSDAELAAIADFLTRAAQRSQEAVERLKEGSGSGERTP